MIVQLFDWQPNGKSCLPSPPRYVNPCEVELPIRQTIFGTFYEIKVSYAWQLLGKYNQTTNGIAHDLL